MHKEQIKTGVFDFEDAKTIEGGIYFSLEGK